MHHVHCVPSVCTPHVVQPIDCRHLTVLDLASPLTLWPRVPEAPLAMTLRIDVSCLSTGDHNHTGPAFEDQPPSCLTSIPLHLPTLTMPGVCLNTAALARPFTCLPPTSLPFPRPPQASLSLPLSRLPHSPSSFSAVLGPWSRNGGVIREMTSSSMTSVLTLSSSPGDRNGVVLTEEQLQQLCRLGTTRRRQMNPGWADRWDQNGHSHRRHSGQDSRTPPHKDKDNQQGPPPPRLDIDKRRHGSEGLPVNNRERNGDDRLAMNRERHTTEEASTDNAGTDRSDTDTDTLGEERRDSFHQKVRKKKGAAPARPRERHAEAGDEEEGYKPDLGTGENEARGRVKRPAHTQGHSGSGEAGVKALMGDQGVCDNHSGHVCMWEYSEGVVTRYHRVNNLSDSRAKTKHVPSESVPATREQNVLMPPDSDVDQGAAGVTKGCGDQSTSSADTASSTQTEVSVSANQHGHHRHEGQIDNVTHTTTTRSDKRKTRRASPETARDNTRFVHMDSEEESGKAVCQQRAEVNRDIQEATRAHASGASADPQTATKRENGSESSTDSQQGEQTYGTGAGWSSVDEGDSSSSPSELPCKATHDSHSGLEPLLSETFVTTTTTQSWQSRSCQHRDDSRVSTMQLPATPPSSPETADGPVDTEGPLPALKTSRSLPGHGKASTVCLPGIPAKRRSYRQVKTRPAQSDKNDAYKVLDSITVGTQAKGQRDSTTQRKRVTRTQAHRDTTPWDPAATAHRVIELQHQAGSAFVTHPTLLFRLKNRQNPQGSNSQKRTSSGLTVDDTLTNWRLPRTSGKQTSSAASIPSSDAVCVPLEGGDNSKQLHSTWKDSSQLSDKRGPGCHLVYATAWNSVGELQAEGRKCLCPSVVSLSHPTDPADRRLHEKKSKHPPEGGLTTYLSQGHPSDLGKPTDDATSIFLTDMSSRGEQTLGQGHQALKRVSAVRSIPHHTCPVPYHFADGSGNHPEMDRQQPVRTTCCECTPRRSQCQTGNGSMTQSGGPVPFSDVQGPCHSQTSPITAHTPDEPYAHTCHCANSDARHMVCQQGVHPDDTCQRCLGHVRHIPWHALCSAMFGAPCIEGGHKHQQDQHDSDVSIKQSVSQDSLVNFPSWYSTTFPIVRRYIEPHDSVFENDSQTTPPVTRHWGQIKPSLQASGDAREDKNPRLPAVVVGKTKILQATKPVNRHTPVPDHSSQTNGKERKPVIPNNKCSLPKYSDTGSVKMMRMSIRNSKRVNAQLSEKRITKNCAGRSGTNESKQLQTRKIQKKQTLYSFKNTPGETNSQTNTNITPRNRIKAPPNSPEFLTHHARVERPASAVNREADRRAMSAESLRMAQVGLRDKFPNSFPRRGQVGVRDVGSRTLRTATELPSSSTSVQRRREIRLRLRSSLSRPRTVPTELSPARKHRDPPHPLPDHWDTHCPARIMSASSPVCKCGVLRNTRSDPTARLRTMSDRADSNPAARGAGGGHTAGKVRQLNHPACRQTHWASSLEKDPLHQLPSDLTSPKSMSPRTPWHSSRVGAAGMAKERTDLAANLKTCTDSGLVQGSAPMQQPGQDIRMEQWWQVERGNDQDWKKQDSPRSSHSGRHPYEQYQRVLKPVANRNLNRSTCVLREQCCHVWQGRSNSHTCETQNFSQIKDVVGSERSISSPFEQDTGGADQNLDHRPDVSLGQHWPDLEGSNPDCAAHCRDLGTVSVDCVTDSPRAVCDQRCTSSNRSDITDTDEEVRTSSGNHALHPTVMLPDHPAGQRGDLANAYSSLDKITFGSLLRVWETAEIEGYPADHDNYLPPVPQLGPSHNTKRLETVYVPMSQDKGGMNSRDKVTSQDKGGGTNSRDKVTSQDKGGGTNSRDKVTSQDKGGGMKVTSQVQKRQCKQDMPQSRDTKGKSVERKVQVREASQQHCIKSAVRGRAGSTSQAGHTGERKTVQAPWKIVAPQPAGSRDLCALQHSVRGWRSSGARNSTASGVNTRYCSRRQEQISQARQQTRDRNYVTKRDWRPNSEWRSEGDGTEHVCRGLKGTWDRTGCPTHKQHPAVGLFEPQSQRETRHVKGCSHLTPESDRKQFHPPAHTAPPADPRKPPGTCTVTSHRSHLQDNGALLERCFSNHSTSSPAAALTKDTETSGGILHAYTEQLSKHENRQDARGPTTQQADRPQGPSTCLQLGVSVLRTAGKLDTWQVRNHPQTPSPGKHSADRRGQGEHGNRRTQNKGGKVEEKIAEPHTTEQR